MKAVLHVGCGHEDIRNCPIFEGWRETRLDIDPACEPDVVASIVDMKAIADGSFEAVYSSHNLEHLHSWEVPKALAEFRRVLKPGGFALAFVPDLQQVAELVATGALEDNAYLSPAGPIRPLDMIFGLQSAVEAGHHHMSHKTGFTAATLAGAFLKAGFREASVFRLGFDLSCEARI